MKKKLLIIPLLFLLGIVLGTDLHAQTYCEPSATNTSRYVDDFTTTGAVLNINNTGTGFSTNGYGDFTSMTLEQEMGEDINFVANHASPSTYGFKIWVDWNQNGTFETNEVAYQSSSYSGSHTGMFTVPVTASTGVTRMRIGNSYIPNSGPADPCETGSTYGEFEDYTFNVLPLPACPKPNTLTATAITSSSVDVDWVEAGSATTWNVEIGPAGFTPGTGNETTADIGNTSSPIASSLAGLAPNTDYDIYVQADCGSGDVSYWQGPLAITTNCVAKIAPWMYDVETAAETTASEIEDCWSSSPSFTTSDFRWNVEGSGGGTPSGSTGPNAPYSDDSYFYTEASSGSQGDSAYLIMPAVDVTALTTPAVIFYSHMYGSNMGQLSVQVSDDNGATWTTEFTMQGQQQTSNSDGWIENIVELNGYSNTILVQFIGSRGGGFNSDIALDDIGVIEMPSCDKPFDLVATDIGKFGATVSWVDTVSSPSFIVEYGPAGFTPGTGTTVTVTDTFAVLTGLISDQDYDYYVKGECSDGTFSLLSARDSFTTLVACAVPTNISVVNVNPTDVEFTWNTPVGGATTFTVEYGPVGFTLGSGTTVTVPPVLITGLTQDTDYDFYIISECGGTDGPSQPAGPINVTTPPTCPAPSNITISDIEIDSAVVSWTENGGATNWVIEYDTVGFTLGSGTNITTTDNPDTLSGLTPGYSYDVYVWADCGAGDLSDTIGPVDFSTDPTCPAPNNLNASNISQTSADLGWTETGAATTWEVEYGTVGFTPGTGTAEIASTNPHTITITSNSDTEFYVRSICGVGDTSFWSGPYSFENYYCVPTNSYSTSYYIDDVITSGALENLNNTGTGFTTGGYADYTATDTLVVYAGQTINVTFAHPSSTNGYALWIDWNNNLDFTDPNENVLSTGYVGTPVSFALTIPAVAPQDTFRMRVRNAYLSNPAPACGDFNYGEAEDYILVVAATPTCLAPSDLTVSNVTVGSAELAWTENSGATTWNIEYGPEGFTPGTGTVVTGVTSNPYTLTGLNSNTSYEFYVQADCGGGDESAWSVASYSFLTECGMYQANGFCEGFDFNTSPTLGCWRVRDANGDGDTWAVSTMNPNTGAYSAIITTDFNSGANDDYLISPALNLTGVEAMKFFYRVQSASEPNDFQVLLSTTGNAPADFQDTLMELAEYTNVTYKDTTVDLTAFTGPVYIAFHVPSGGLDGWRLYIDDVCFGECIPTPGQDGSTDVCRLDGTLDLSNGIITNSNSYGNWEYPADQTLIQNDTLLDLSALAAGSHEVLYIVDGLCQPDTTIATVNVFDASSAGSGTTPIGPVCKSNPIDLFDGITGNVDMDGDWYDDNGVLLANALPNAPDAGGSYNYTYITSNGVCPADTAVVVVTVDASCDYWSVEEESFTDISVYPNPTTRQLNIVNPSNTSSLKVEMLDMNGRVVLVENKALNNASEATIAIEHLEKGIYTLRVYNDEGQKTFKIVKQ